MPKSDEEFTKLYGMSREAWRKEMRDLSQRSVQLEPGKKYRVRYQIPGVYNRPREMVAMFLDSQPDPLSQAGTDKLFFSGRPKFGTTELNLAHIFGIWSIDDNADCYVNLKYNDGDRIL